MQAARVAELRARAAVKKANPMSPENKFIPVAGDLTILDSGPYLLALAIYRQGLPRV
jgi:hypothetical protein